MRYAPSCFLRPRLWGIVATLLVLGGCSSTVPRSVESLADTEQETVRRLREVAAAESTKLLDNQDAIQQQMRKIAPKPAILPVEPKFDPLESKRISIALSRASISQVLAAFADSARMNLIVEPAVVQESALSDMYLREISLREAFNEVLRNYDVAGQLNGQTLRLQLHEEKFFSLNFLNANAQLDMTSGGNVFGSNSGGSGGGSGGSGGSGSNSSALNGTLTMSGGSNTKTDLYAEIESNIRAILGEMRTQERARPAAAQGTAANTGATGNTASSVPGTPNANQQGFTINRITGTLYVKTRPSKMRAVEKMLERAQAMLGKQVYVEAQIVDIHLSDNFQFGVDWSLLRGRLAANFGAEPLSLGGAGVMGNSMPPRALTIPAKSIGPDKTGLGLGWQDGSGRVIINALRSFGNLRILSNPNVQVRNGSPALLSVGTSYRYVSRSSSNQNIPSSGSTFVSSDVQTDSVFSGVMVGVLPFMREDGRIELLINPMQSEVDPESLRLIDVSNGNRVTLPKINYKGMTTTLNVGDGDVVVIGGLIDQRSSNTDNGAPALSDIPLLGKLFTQNANEHASRELVVVLRVRAL